MTLFLIFKIYRSQLHYRSKLLTRFQSSLLLMMKLLLRFATALWLNGPK